jgi:membrane protease YdiL (CAAX protease family)
MRLADMLKRAAQFIRSVIPSDPWQLIFLAGVIFLLISPRLHWPSNLDNFVAALWSLGFSQGVAVTDLMRVVNIPLNLMTFGALAGYAACFWPGDKPVRRVLLSVVLPTLLSLTIIFQIFVQRSRPAYSIFESHATFLPVFRWLRANSLNLPVGLYSSLLSLLLIALFTFRLYSGTSSLPLALPHRPAAPTQSPNSWSQLQLLIFILVGPFFLLRALAEAFLGLPTLLWRDSIPSFYLSVELTLASVADAATLIALPVWILGPWGKKAARNSLQLPEPRYAVIAFLLPLVVTGLPSLARYVVDRANWAAHYFGQTTSPQLNVYFDLARLHDSWLLLMVFGAFSEEIVFRGLLLPKLMNRYGFHRGIFLNGMVWAAIHFRNDRYPDHSVAGVLLFWVFRILICLAMNYVLSWMTLRWHSIIPAGITHTVSNILIVSRATGEVPWNYQILIALWGAVAFLLFRFWPLAQAQPVETGLSAPDPASAI